MKSISNIFLSSDWKLQLAFMKMESLVIIDQEAMVNTYLGFVHTARHMPEVGSTWSFSFFLRVAFKIYFEDLFLINYSLSSHLENNQGGIGNWDEVVTR